MLLQENGSVAGFISANISLKLSFAICGYTIEKTLGTCQRSFLLYGTYCSHFPNSLILCDDLFLVIRTALLAYSVRHHQRAAFAALYKSRSAHFPVSPSLVASSFGRFIFRTDRHSLTPPYLPNKYHLSPPFSHRVRTYHIRIYPR